MQLAAKNISSLPAPEIISALREARETSRVSDAQSSYWKHYAQLGQVSISDDSIGEFKGAAFGEYSSRLPEWILGPFNYLTYLIKVSIPLKAIFSQIKFLRRLRVPLVPYDSLRHAIMMAFLTDLPASNLSQAPSSPKILIIGDGFGLLSALMKSNFPGATITIVDLQHTMLYSSLFLQDRFPGSMFKLLRPEERIEDVAADFRFVRAEQIQTMTTPQDEFDFAINVASMQEMDPHWVQFYFSWLRTALKSSGQFYCSNRVHKRLPDGTESVFLEYPWRPTDTVLLDEEPEFHRWFFSIQRTSRRVRLFGIPIPFMCLFDGDNRHRLVQLSR